MAASKVKTLTIISIILGALGLIGVFNGAVAFFIGPQAPTRPIGGMTAEQLEAHQAMARAFLNVSNTWKIYNGLELIVSLLVAAALMAGGIMSLRHRKTGRDVLAATFAVAIPFKVVQAMTSVLIGMASMQIMHEFLPKIMNGMTSGSPLSAGAEEMATSIAEASALLGVAFGVIWILLQLVFYVVGSTYLRKPEVRAVFGS